MRKRPPQALGILLRIVSTWVGTLSNTKGGANYLRLLGSWLTQRSLHICTIHDKVIGLACMSRYNFKMCINAIQ